MLKYISKYNLIIITSICILMSLFIFNKPIDFIEKIYYKNDYEYKFIKIGYEEKDAKILNKKLSIKNKKYLLTIDVNKNIIDIVNDNYYINNNLYKYINFMNSKNESNSRSIVEHINAGRENEFYTTTEKADISKKELILVNKYHYLEEDYVPDNLVNISQKYSWGEEGSQKCETNTYDAFLKMWNNAKNEGHYLMVSSSYRDFEKQNNIFENYKNNYGIEYAENYVAHPGYSEHQTGYALDIVDKNFKTKSTFTTSQAFEWMKNNSYKFGFILRYQENKESVTGTNFESWHYRYVGTEVAKYIYENNITFDEYYEYFIEN